MAEKKSHRALSLAEFLGPRASLAEKATHDLGVEAISQAIATSLKEVTRELCRATELHGPFASSHEGYAVILEELDELWEHVKRRAEDRDLAAMRREAIQVAAMALRFVVDVCGAKTAPEEEDTACPSAPCSTCSEEPSCG